MKSLAELEQIRKQTLERINLRKEDKADLTRIVVGMATCGIAAGARPVLNALVEAVAKENLDNVTVTQTGCIGMCRLEPIVEVFVPDKERVTYVKMTPDKVPEIIEQHIKGGKPVVKYTIGAVQE